MSNYPTYNFNQYANFTAVGDTCQTRLIFNINYSPIFTNLCTRVERKNAFRVTIKQSAPLP